VGDQTSGAGDDTRALEPLEALPVGRRLEAAAAQGEQLGELGRRGVGDLGGGRPSRRQLGDPMEALDLGPTRFDGDPEQLGPCGDLAHDQTGGQEEQSRLDVVSRTDPQRMDRFGLEEVVRQRRHDGAQRSCSPSADRSGHDHDDHQREGDVDVGGQARRTRQQAGGRHRAHHADECSDGGRQRLVIHGVFPRHRQPTRP